MTIKYHHVSKPSPLPDGLADVALIDARTCTAVGGMLVSWWHEEVRTGRAPAPVIRQPRCTRWLLSEVREYWASRAKETNPEVAQQVLAHAKRASGQAKKQRDDRGEVR